MYELRIKLDSAEFASFFEEISTDCDMGHKYVTAPRKSYRPIDPMDILGKIALLFNFAI